MPWLVAALGVSLLGVHGSIWRGSGLGLAAALVTFVFTLAAVALKVNGAYWLAGRGPAILAPSMRIEATQRNARLLAFAYAWAALAMWSSYGLTDLRWRHGWQYALAMGLVAVFCFQYAIRIWRARNEPQRLASLQAMGVPLAVGQLALGLGGLMFLFGAGKLASPRSDWVANQIFAAGAAAIVHLSVLALATDRSLARPGPVVTSTSTSAAGPT